MSNHAFKTQVVVAPIATQADCTDVRDSLARELDEAIRHLREVTENSPAANKQAIRHALLW